MIKTPEEMLELVKKMDRKTPWSYDGEDNFFEVVDIDRLTICGAEDDDIGEFIAASGEFVPYSAERLIEAERLLKEVVKDGKGISEILLLVKEIKQFMEAIRET